MSFMGGGTLGVLRSWFAQGAMCVLSSFFSPILVSKSIIAELLPDRSRAFFIISEMSIPPPPPPPFAGFTDFIVNVLPDLFGFGLFTGRVCVFEESTVVTARLGRGGAADCALWVGLVREGMGVEGRGGGEMGVSS